MLIIFYRIYLCVSISSHVIVMSLVMCVYSLSGVGSLLMWPEAKKDIHPTSQIKAVIVTLTTTKANERQIGYRNKHFGDTGGATLQWECGHRPWVTLSPLGRPSTGRNLGMAQGACRSLVLKTNLGPVIHKSLVYQCLETLLCTFHQSGGTPLSPEKKKGFISRVKTARGAIGPLNQKWQALLCEWSFQKWSESYINATLRFYFCPC